MAGYPGETMRRVELGPFVLERRIGRGGMSEVWRGFHMDDDVAVAVKVLMGERARRPRSVRQFRLEAHAVARLDHPHIVAIHDIGEIPEDAATLTEGALEPGAPYLVMDLLPAGSLWKYRGRLAWPDLRSLLAVLLDGLAHAHARGVIHRDLKPSNVLLSAERRAVISDFGLAHVAESDTVLLRAGTPSYMAPEQFLDQWRDFGPWTDLYGFGCLVWTLCAGAPPFRRASWEDTRRAHLEEDLPPFTSLQPVPTGFEDWLRLLLHRDPVRRLQCAADAAWALDQIEPDDLGADDLQSMVEPEDVDLILPEPTSFGAGPSFRPIDTGTVRPFAGRNDAPPPPPHDWRGPRTLPRMHLRGTGLGLLGSRALPTVGREVERDVLWNALVQVHRLPLARAVLLEGPSGTGKTHLARWLSQHAHQTGAASTLWVDHGQRESSGLSGLLRTHLGLDGVPYDEIPERVEEAARGFGTVSRADQQVLVDIVLDEGTRAAHGAPERLAALSRHLCAVGARRPVVLVIDDAQRATEALLLARWLLRRREAEPTPVLVVLVVQDEGLAQHRPARELLAEIAQYEGVDRVRVDALSEQEQITLVREMVGLEGELARRVAARTGGNPAFAVALLEDWVERGVLVQAEGGFRLRDGAPATLPDDLHAVWAGHLEHALADYAEEVWGALELAAVLGMRVDTEEWLRMATHTDLMASVGVVEELVDRRLAVGTHPSVSWRFVHPMVRESLLRRAEDAGRLAALHELVVDDLLERPGVDDQRMARHLLGAKRPGDALRRLLQAARSLHAIGNLHGALDLCDQAEAALVKAPDLVSRWRRPILLQRARALVLLGRLDEAEVAALPPASDRGASLLEACEARVVLATIGILRGHLEASRDELDAVIRLARDSGLEEVLARALRAAAMAAHRLGLLDQALRLASEARDVAGRILDWPTWGDATAQIAATLTTLGHLREAGTLVDEALRTRDQVQQPAVVASMLAMRGEIERRKGYPDRAVPPYEEAVDLLDRMGSLEAVVPRLSLAVLHAVDGRYGDAWRTAERCRRETALQGRPPLELEVRAVLLVSALGLSDRAAWEAQASRILELAADGVGCGPDGYTLMAGAIQLLRTLHDDGLARALLDVVRRWLAGPGRPHAAEIGALIGLSG
jgi:serine/threonine protein kinase/tetratricopeptide (TPR) repeat protein